MMPFIPLHKLMRRSADGDWHEKHSYTAASSSATDCDSSLPFLEHAHQPHPVHPFRHLLRVLGAILAATALIAIILLVSIHPSRRLSPIPIFPIETLIFRQDPAYAAPASSSSDALWDSNLPNGKGFLLLKDASEYRLPPGLPSGENNATDLYGVTWTHEYHCLVSPAIFIIFFFVFRNPNSADSFRGLLEAGTHGILEGSGWHEQIIRRRKCAATISKDGSTAAGSCASKFAPTGLSAAAIIENFQAHIQK